MAEARRTTRRQLVRVAGIAAVAAGALVAPQAAAATAPGGTVWVPERMCGTPTPGTAACDGIRLVRTSSAAVAANTPRAMRRSSPGAGPTGGYSPAQLAAAYGLSVASSAASGVTVGIVDAFDDPSVGTDLASFDSHYGIPAETASSFRVVNQDGGATLPTADGDWAGEITLDVQAVRGLCHKCKILLVETNSNSFADLATGVNRAVTMGATVVSNSYGAAENPVNDTPTVQAAYNHPGVAIVASSGDDGWYDWDVINDSTAPSTGPNAPAVYPTVVGVGGTSLYLNPNGSRASEQVWNTNGPADAFANFAGFDLGAAGSGCSTISSAKPWQSHVSGYGSLGCAAGMRSAVDIAAVADPFTGYDIFETYPAGTGSWSTIGGTSLASPVIAAMWALAGGPKGVAYPSLSLYGHFASDHTAHTYDVTVGGTGFCGIENPAGCFDYWSNNPNALGDGTVDCGFGASGSAVLAHRAQCYAQPGYDGVAGVGTPKGTTVFTPMSPTATIKHAGAIKHGHAASFSAHSSTDPFPGGSISSYSWNWGDGTTSTGAAPSHTYAKKGSRTITLTVKDNYGRSAKTRLHVKVT